MTEPNITDDNLVELGLFAAMENNRSTMELVERAFAGDQVARLNCAILWRRRREKE